jgi:ribosomal protein S18 acetylase RimI-like enzyme
MNIRPMQPSDWQNVTEINQLAFDAYYHQTNRPLQKGKRTQENIQSALAMFPPGCFVAEEGERMLGFVFSRCWGKQGWIGVFGVDPKAQGKGVGKQLLAASIVALQSAGCNPIGLETMPASPYNVGLYMSMGFMPGYNALYMVKEVDSTGDPYVCPTLQQVPLDEGLVKISQISRLVNPSVDYALEARNALEYQWGDVLLPGWPDPWGLAVIRTKNIRDVGNPFVCSPVAVALLEEHRQRYPEILALIEQYAAKLGADEIMLNVNSQEHQALRQTIDYGFRVNRVNVRMVMNPPYADTPGLDLNRWTM